MMKRRFIRQFGRARRGSALMEFTFSALIIIGALMTTLEFGIEMFLRQSAERAVAAAGRSYAENWDPGAAQDAALAQMPVAFQDCIQPLSIRIHETASGLEGSGREAMGNNSDNSAEVARLRLECRWNRLTPLPRRILGEQLVHVGQIVVRQR